MTYATIQKIKSDTIKPLQNSMVRSRRLELPRVAPLPPQGSVSGNLYVFSASFASPESLITLRSVSNETPKVTDVTFATKGVA